MKRSAQLDRPRVYSYIRFSTPEQKLGDSLRRQMENAKAYAEERGLAFDEQLRDEGLSGFHGAHRKKGKLGSFLESVQSGRVPAGSVLFVEELDRLSREGMTEALETIVFGLIKHGITIATLTGDYDRESLNSGGIWKLIAKLETGHEESRKKAERLGRAWAEKKRLARASGTVLTSRVPAWFKVVNGKLVEQPDAIAAVRLIFDLAPTLGRSRLVKKLNDEAPWKPRNGWRMSYVRKILTNRAVIGEYQPFTRRGGGPRRPEGDPIPNYYPAIIAPEVFHAMQQRIQQNRGKGGRTGASLNLFKNIVKCAYCGGSMVSRDHGKPPKGAHYLICDNGARKFKCERHRVRYDEIQALVLRNCRELRPDQVLPDATEKTRRCENLRRRIDGAENEHSENLGRISNLTDQIERTTSPSARDRYEKRSAELEARNGELVAQMTTDRATLQQEAQSSESFANWQKGLAGMIDAIAPREAIDARLRLQSHLKEFIAKIEIFADGVRPAQESEAVSTNRADDLAEYVRELADEHGWEEARTPGFRRFLRELSKLQSTKQGRFYRLHFKSGRIVDLVPPGSFAVGQELVHRAKNQWRFVRPEIGQLWEQFTTEAHVS